MTLRDLKTIEERRKYLEKLKNIDLEEISIFPEKLRQAEKKNCENMAGAVQIPLGIAGPLKIKGQQAKGDYYIPLATTEGALVASVNRGCKAITLSDGVSVFGEYQGMTRGAVFEVENLEKGFDFKNWLFENFADLAKAARGNSSHLTLLKADAQVLGKNIFVRFSFDCQDAMGMNMVTIAVTAIAEYIKNILGITCLSVAANFDTDKKPAWLNSIKGRGRQAWADAFIESRVVAEVLKTTPQKIHKTWLHKCMLGSAISGSMGFNGHFANIVAAIFLACGQDSAHVVEGSLGITTTEITGSKLYISVFLPDLCLGTIGGGAYLPSQNKMLNLLGISGGNGGRNAAAFAEIVASAVLAGELSLLASLSEGTLAQAHVKLGRGMKT